MCDILLRVVDKDHNPALRPLASLAGDVIVVMPDGHEWGRAEIGNPDWRIVRLPSRSVAEFEDMLRAREAPREVDMNFAMGQPGSMKMIAARNLRIRIEEPWLAERIATNPEFVVLDGDDASAFAALKERREGDVVETM